MRKIYTFVLFWNSIKHSKDINAAIEVNEEMSVIVMILSFRTDRSGQTVQTQIRLLLEEQSDQGLHCLQFPLHLLDALL